MIEERFSSDCFCKQVTLNHSSIPGLHHKQSKRKIDIPRLTLHGSTCGGELRAPNASCKAYDFHRITLKLWAPQITQQLAKEIYTTHLNIVLSTNFMTMEHPAKRLKTSNSYKLYQEQMARYKELMDRHQASIDRHEQMMARHHELLNQKQMCANCMSQLEPRSQRRRDTSLTLPVEIIARVLDFLPQHRVYPFLSLSKAIDRIAKRRLFRKVFVLEENSKPLLHDAIDELLHWLYLTEAQFLYLMEIEFEWPGKYVHIETCLWKDSLKGAIKKHLLPAEVVSYRCSIAYVTKASQLSTLSPHITRLLLEGPLTLEPMATKLVVDHLWIRKNVKGVHGCIDLSSVKQLTLGHALCDDDDNIYKLAAHLTNLEDLELREKNFEKSYFDRFPKIVKRVFLPYCYDDRYEYEKVTEPFQLLLEYIELSQKCEPLCYPQRHLSVAKSNTGLLIDYQKYPKLKLFVRRDAVFKVCRVLGEYYKCEQINEYKLDW